MQNISYQIRSITKRISLYLACENVDASFINHSGTVGGQEVIQLQVIDRVTSELSISRETKEKIFFASESPELTSEELNSAIAVFKLLKQWGKELEQKAFGKQETANATISEPENSIESWTKSNQIDRRESL